MSRLRAPVRTVRALTVEQAVYLLTMVLASALVGFLMSELSHR